MFESINQYPPLPVAGPSLPAPRCLAQGQSCYPTDVSSSVRDIANEADGSNT